MASVQRGGRGGQEAPESLPSSLSPSNAIYVRSLINHVEEELKPRTLVILTTEWPIVRTEH